MCSLFCSYNEVGYLNNMTTLTLPFVTDVQKPVFSDETFDWAFSNIPDIEVPFSNYYNEGYTMLNLGIGSVLPEPEAGAFDVLYNMAIVKGSGDDFTETINLNLYKSQRALYN